MDEPGEGYTCSRKRLCLSEREQSKEDRKQRSEMVFLEGVGGEFKSEKEP